MIIDCTKTKFLCLSALYTPLLVLAGHIFAGKTCQVKKILAKKTIGNRCFNIPRMSWTWSARWSLNAQAATWILKLPSPISAWLFCTIWIHCPTPSLSKCSSSPASSRKTLSKSLPKLPIPHDDRLDSSQSPPSTHFPPSSQNDRLFCLCLWRSVAGCSLHILRMSVSHPPMKCIWSWKSSYSALWKERYWESFILQIHIWYFIC